MGRLGAEGLVTRYGNDHILTDRGRAVLAERLGAAEQQ